VLTEHGIKIAPGTNYERVSCPVSAAELADAYAPNIGP
jgi:putative transposase